MLWFRKHNKSEAEDESVEGDVITSTELSIGFDKSIAAEKLKGLLVDVSESGTNIESLAEAQANKQKLFSLALNKETIQTLDRDSILTLLDCVFTARRKLLDIFTSIDEEVLKQAIIDVMTGSDEIEVRLTRFTTTIVDGESTEKAVRKKRRAAWDFAAECLHYNDPEYYPLMARWVWDVTTVSGVMREFIRNNDSFGNDIPLGTDPGTFESFREFLRDCLANEGYYRDVHYMIDLVMAKAYADYMRAMTMGAGMIQAEFGGRQDPLEYILKLIGIDSRKPSSNEDADTKVLH